MKEKCNIKHQKELKINQNVHLIIYFTKKKRRKIPIFTTTLMNTCIREGGGGVEITLSVKVTIKPQERRNRLL